LTSTSIRNQNAWKTWKTRPCFPSNNPSRPKYRYKKYRNGVDSSQPESFPRKVAELVSSSGELVKRGEAASDYAERHFTQSGFAERFDDALRETVARAS
jgi:hypothetical protein